MFVLFRFMVELSTVDVINPLIWFSKQVKTNANYYLQIVWHGCDIIKIIKIIRII